MAKSKYTAKFKFDRVIESLKKGSVSEVARSYGVRANLLSKWRSEFLERGAEVFENKPDKNITKLQKRIAKLEQLLGKKEVELALIKNFSDFYESHGGE